ncbi:hypothetical protein COSO111634_36060 [Corallococcus soli]
MVRIQEARKRLRELVTGFEALLPVRGQRLHHDVVQLAGQVRPEHAGGRNLAASHPRHHYMRRTFHRQLAAQQFIQNDAGGPDVRARIHVLPARLLRREVEVLALHHARLRPDAPQELGLGDTEVDDLDLALVAQQHVVRRDVAVDDVQRRAAAVRARVRVVQPPAHLHRDEDRDGNGQGGHATLDGALEDTVEGLAVHELHGEEVLAVHAAEVEDLGDVAMGERGGDARLADEHGDEGLVVRVLGEDLLDEDRLGHPGGAHQLRAPRLRHAAPAQPGHQLIPPERVPHLKCHVAVIFTPEIQECGVGRSTSVLAWELAPFAAWRAGRLAVMWEAGSPRVQGACVEVPAGSVT